MLEYLGENGLAPPCPAPLITSRNAGFWNSTNRIARIGFKLVRSLDRQLRHYYKQNRYDPKGLTLAREVRFSRLWRAANQICVAEFARIQEVTFYPSST